MAQLTLEDLRKSVELLKEVETLQDASIRMQMQQLILGAMSPPPTIETVNGVQPPAPAAPASSPRRMRRSRAIEDAHNHPPSALPAAGTQRGKVYEAVRVWGSHGAPVSSADLERELPDLPTEGITKILSQLYADGLLVRRQIDDIARDGNNRLVYKYYVDRAKGP